MSRPPRTSLSLRQCLLCLVVIGCVSLFTQAATLTVTNTNDSGAGSLRQAIMDAAFGDTILFALPAGSTILLTSGELFVNKNLLIQGPGANVLTINGNNNDRIFRVAAGQVTIQGLTLTRGASLSGDLNGGAIHHGSGFLTVVACTITNNVGAMDGGGIYNAAGATLELRNSTLSNNESGFGSGGGIANYGVMTIENCTLSGNASPDGAFGGGIYNQGNLTIRQTTITLNLGGDGGGGISNLGIVQLKSTIVARNIATLGLDILGGVTSQGFNLIGNNKDAAINNVMATDLIGTPNASIDPRLAPLAFNGGPTRTHALLLDSPALDAGISNAAIDQRFLPRQVNLLGFNDDSVGDQSDIGAYEHQFDPLLQTSDQKPGSVLMFPYYTSNSATRADTRITISNISDSTSAAPVYVHVFFIEGSSCNQNDFFICLTPNASLSISASDYDPQNTGSILAVVTDVNGVPTQNTRDNVLIGNAFVRDGEFVGNYGAQAFRALWNTPARVTGGKVTLYFNNIFYEAVPSEFSLEIQSPVDVPVQKVVLSGMHGDLTNSQLRGTGQISTGLIYNGNETPFGSFSAFLRDQCQVIATVNARTPRVPNGLDGLIPAGHVGTMRFTTGAAVGLLLTPNRNQWKGIRALHFTKVTQASITIPIFKPTC